MKPQRNSYIYMTKTYKMNDLKSCTAGHINSQKNSNRILKN